MKTDCRWLLAAFGFMLAAIEVAGQDDPEFLTLSKDGTSACRVVVAGDAAGQVRAVAEDLADIFEQITGARLPVETDDSK